MSSSEEDNYVKGKTFQEYMKEKEKVIEEKKDPKEGKEASSAPKKKATKDDKKEKKGAKDWTDDEISLLIEMLEERPCLWDVFDKQYSKRDIREIAYTEIASALDVPIESLKTKINGIRAQFGRELAKVNKTKSGQSTDELYVSGWVHYQRLLFLAPVIKSTKSRDTFKRNINVENEEEKDIDQTPRQKKQSIAERKLDLLSKCTEAITKPAKPTELPPVNKHSAFSIYIDERLSKLGTRERRYAEKRISDVLFDIEMQAENEQSTNRHMAYGSYGNQSYYNSTPMQGNSGNSSFSTTSSVQGQSYTDMLNAPY